jgi:hypothetical protein
LLTTIKTHHKAIVTSQIDPSNFGVIKILVRTVDVRPRVDARLRRVEFLLYLR